MRCLRFLPLLQVAVEGGQLRIKQEGRNRKFMAAVNEKTFAGSTGGCTFAPIRATLCCVAGFCRSPALPSQAH